MLPCAKRSIYINRNAFDSYVEIPMCIGVVDCSVSKLEQFDGKTELWRIFTRLVLLENIGQIEFIKVRLCMELRLVHT